MSSGVFQNLALFIVDTLFSLYVLVLLIRSLLVIAQADYYNPLSQFIVRITEPPLFPLRRLVPPVGRVDLSCWLLAYAVKLGEIVLLMLIQGQSWPTSALAAVAAIQIAETVIHVYIFALIILAVSSWFMSGVQQLHHPVISLIHGLTGPVLEPVRRVVPPVGILDFSVLIAIFLLYLILTVLRSLY